MESNDSISLMVNSRFFTVGNTMPHRDAQHRQDRRVNHLFLRLRSRFPGTRHSSLQTSCHVALLLLLTSFALSSCDESLPPRTTPSQLLKAQLGRTDSTVAIYWYPESDTRQIIGSAGSILIFVTNEHDEVLQGDFDREGWVDIWLDMLGTSGTNRLDVTSFFPNDPMQVNNGVLTLHPGETLTLQAQWNHQTVGGKPFWLMGSRTLVVPPLGDSYYETQPMTFVGRGNVQVFKQTAPLQTPEFRFTLVYREYIKESHP